MIRFRLTHGPIDCLCGIDGGADAVRSALVRAESVFSHILPGLCAELPLLRAPLPSARPLGPVAAAMHDAVARLASPLKGECRSGGWDRTEASASKKDSLARDTGFCFAAFITPMAAVAGAVADHLLAAIATRTEVRRAFVNNGGDIAIHLAPGETLTVGMVADLAAPSLDATLRLERSAGVATSGRACKGKGGRSFSFGIADAVTIIARTAALADAAATVVANAVNLPGHPSVIRRPARDIDPDSDLGGRMIVWDVGPLAPGDIDAALDAGLARAKMLREAGLIDGAALALRGRLATIGEVTTPLLEPA